MLSASPSPIRAVPGCSRPWSISVTPGLPEPEVPGCIELAEAPVEPSAALQNPAAREALVWRDRLADTALRARSDRWETYWGLSPEEEGGNSYFPHGMLRGARTASTSQDPAAPVKTDGTRLDRETNPGATSAAPPGWSEAAPTKSWHRDSCGRDRALPAGQTEAYSFGPVPAGGGPRRHGEQQRHWPRKNAASGRTENREGKPASGSLQAPAVPVHFHVHTTGRWRAIPPSGRNFAFLRSISTPEPG